MRTESIASGRSEQPAFSVQAENYSPLAAAMTTGQALGAVLDAWSTDFHTAFRDCLTAAGLETDWDIPLRITVQGFVVVNDVHPDKPAIDAIFVSQPVLAERYRAIAGDSSILAASRIGRRYSVLADDVHLTSADRRALGEDLLTRIDQLETLAGRMTVTTTGLVSDALAYADAYGARLC